MTLTLVPATAADLPVMQNLGRFYVYDMARHCGARPGWDCPPDGLWVCVDFAPYVADARFHPFLLRHGAVPAGFTVVEALGPGAWNMAQFFIAAPYQRQSHGRALFHALLHRFPGTWRIDVIPENIRALAFWRRVTAEAAADQVTETQEAAEPDDEWPDRIVLRFRTAPARGAPLGFPTPHKA